MIYLYNKHVYPKDVYMLMRKYNRAEFKKNPEEYCARQIDFEPMFEISIQGKVYYFNEFERGMWELKKYYNSPIDTRIRSFNALFNMGKKLYSEVDYIIYRLYTDINTTIRYLSHENRFEAVLSDKENRLKYFYGDVEKIKEIINEQ